MQLGPERSTLRSCVAGQGELKLPACVYTAPVFTLMETHRDFVDVRTGKSERQCCLFSAKSTSESALNRLNEKNVLIHSVCVLDTICVCCSHAG